MSVIGRYWPLLSLKDTGLAHVPVSRLRLSIRPVFKTGWDAVLHVLSVINGFVSFEGNGSPAHRSIETRFEK